MKLQTALFMSKKNDDKFTYRIYYEDTDSGGVVYYANYLKFFERARTDFLRKIDISQEQLAQNEQLIFVVRRCKIDYHYPARLDDEVNVSVKIIAINKVSLTILQEMTKSSKLIAHMEVQIVCLNNKSFKPNKLPQKLIDSIYV